MRPLFGPRTIVEAAFLVAVPVVALEAGLSWPVIIGAGAVGYLLVLAVEGALWRQGKRTGGAASSDLVPVRRPEPEPVREPPRLVPVPDPVPLPPAPEPELPPAATVTRIGGPRQWNVWDLEQLAREHAGGDPIADEERTFLLLYLRDHAGPDGMLPVDFDDLVRQSFGGLVANL
jgi:hypothetical protein